mgnify:CR=1 FL=1
MAAQGLRDVGDGYEAVANPKQAAQLKQQARTVLTLSLISAAIATALVVVVSL